MSNIVNWDNAPEWANYMAQDADGTWYWYEFEPSSNSRYESWDTEGGRVLDVSAYNDNWKDTLEKRHE